MRWVEEKKRKEAGGDRLEQRTMLYGEVIPKNGNEKSEMDTRFENAAQECDLLLTALSRIITEREIKTPKVIKKLT